MAPGDHQRRITPAAIWPPMGVPVAKWRKAATPIATPTAPPNRPLIETGPVLVARPNWEYVRIDVLLPDHPKYDGLSDKAVRTLLELWCWCGLNRTDGFVRDAKWKTFGTKTARDQLLRVPPGYKRGFAEQVEGGYQMHDFIGPDGHQRSKEEIDELSARRAAAGRKGGLHRPSKPQASA